MITRIFKSKIKGISCVIPPKEYSILDDKDLYNGDEKKIKRLINSSGILKRRIADTDVTTSDLCFQAAETLINDLNIKRETIDALCFISYTPDLIMPATSYILHKRLNLSQNCICMDIPQACSGYVLGLYQASMLINSGCKRVLLLVGDTFSKFTDMFINHKAPVFGDAGSATIIDYSEQATPMFFNINSSGEDYEALICKNGLFRNPPKISDFYENGDFKYLSNMNGGKIFDFTLANITPNIQKLLEFAEVNIESFDYYLFHQANKFILENIARQLNINIEKMPVNTLKKYGNQCGASIPCTISDNFNEELLTKNLNCLLAGFGVGLSWASAIVNFDKVYCSKINEYRGDYE